VEGHRHLGSLADRDDSSDTTDDVLVIIHLKDLLLLTAQILLLTPLTIMGCESHGARHKDVGSLVGRFELVSLVVVGL
jgi:hypothetical protein